tara:strand:- start:2217 stop:2780 length:564 start_codon:yes stop_codon:yes gene_type:complete
MFRWEAKQNSAKSKVEGRPIFDQVPFVTIMSPGDNKNVIDAKVNDDHKSRWPRQWEAFQKGSEQPLNGTPINEWPALNMAQVAELKALNIFSIEQLANLDDRGTQEMTGLVTLKQQAQAHLAVGKDDGVIYEALDKVDKLTEEIAAMRAENKELRQELDFVAKKSAASKPRKKKINVSTDDSTSNSG